MYYNYKKKVTENSVVRENNWTANILIVPGSRHKGLHLTLSGHFEKVMQVYVLINYRYIKSTEKSLFN